jgi:hypothetical protein
METKISNTLTERLHRCGMAWSAAHEAPLTRLGRIVVNDGGLLQRISQPGASVTTATLEKFAGFLADPANWPEGEVPQEALNLAHVVGVSAAAPTLSPGKTSDNSRQAAA